MSIYDRVAQRALTQIAKKGAIVTFPGTGTAPVYDADTDTWTPGTPGDDVIGRAVQIPGDPDRFAALSLVLTNPVTLLVAAAGLDVTPAPGMSMTWAGTAYAIADIEAVAPDGAPIIYTLTGSA